MEILDIYLLAEGIINIQANLGLLPFIGNETNHPLATNNVYCRIIRTAPKSSHVYMGMPPELYGL